MNGRALSHSDESKQCFLTTDCVVLLCISRRDLQRHDFIGHKRLSNLPSCEVNWGSAISHRKRLEGPGLEFLGFYVNPIRCNLHAGRN